MKWFKLKSNLAISLIFSKIASSTNTPITRHSTARSSIKMMLFQNRYWIRLSNNLTINDVLIADFIGQSIYKFFSFFIHHIFCKIQ